MKDAQSYDKDVIAWATEQARLLRKRRFDELDIEHLADEIEDVGKAEQREFARRMAALLAHLLRWQMQPGRRCTNWQSIIALLRRTAHRHCAGSPSLRAILFDPDWQADMWSDAVLHGVENFDLAAFPEVCPWSFDDVLACDWFPEGEQRGHE